MLEGIHESHWETFIDFSYGNAVTMATMLFHVEPWVNTILL